MAITQNRTGSWGLPSPISLPLLLQIENSLEYRLNWIMTLGPVGKLVWVRKSLCS